MIAAREYFAVLAGILDRVDAQELAAATELLDAAYRSNRVVFTVGNGQSATTASAFALDLTKQSAPADGGRRFRTISVADNVAAITAWANDVRFDDAFAEQLRGLIVEGDLLVMFSVSGSSPSVLQASRVAREAGAKVVALTGARGSRHRHEFDVLLRIDSHDYGHVETAHVAVCHYWVDLFRERIERYMVAGNGGPNE